MQFAFIYISTLVVNFTAYRCARAAIVGEHEEMVDAQRSGVDVVAQTLLAPLAGRSLANDDYHPEAVTIPGWGELRRSDYAAAKTYVHITEPDEGESGPVTALVEYNQELIFPFVDGLFRMIMRNDHSTYTEGTKPEHAFGDEDTTFQGLGSGDYIPQGDDRGRVRIIGGKSHFVITRQCTLYRSNEALEN
jgi:hypothetical protein